MKTVQVSCKSEIKETTKTQKYFPLNRKHNHMKKILQNMNTRQLLGLIQFFLSS